MSFVSDSHITYTIEPVGFVRSELTRLESAPHQGDEEGPQAWLDINSQSSLGLEGIIAGDELFVLTWLHLAQRDVLLVHPRGNTNRPLTGVFKTRSPDRPNPIGIHRVTVLEVRERKLLVKPIEAIDGTPIVDIKPVISGIDLSDR